MKKVYTFIMLLSVGSVTFVGCGSSKKASKTDDILGGGTTGTVVKAVASVVGVILLTKLLKSVLGTMGGSSSFSSLTQSPTFVSSFNETTPLTNIAGNDVQKLALQLLVANKYKIPFVKVQDSYASFTTAGDLATFIGQNADAAILKQIQ